MSQILDQDLSQDLQQQVLTALGDSTPLHIQGGGSKHFLAQSISLSQTNNTQPLEMSSHRGIVSYDPVELVITARAGTPLREIEQALADQRQILPFEPPHFSPKATLGGTIACGLSGPSRPFRGSARDYVLGVKIINGKGEILRFGGQVMKNVAGYDCSRLMTGAMGTLGVLLEVSLKVLPKQSEEITLVQKHSTLEALTIINAWSGKPLPLSAACCDGRFLYLRLSGTKTALKSASKLIGGEILSNSAAFWQDIKEHRHPFFQTDNPLWRLSLPLGVSPVNLTGSWLIDWAGAQRWLITDVEPNDVRAIAHSLGGHATLFRRASLDIPTFHLPNENIMELHRRLKQAFDPIGILNPGHLYPGL